MIEPPIIIKMGAYHRIVGARFPGLEQPPTTYPAIILLGGPPFIIVGPHPAPYGF